MLEAKEWKPVLTESFHPIQYASQIAAEILGKDVSQHRTFSKSVPGWRWPLWGVALEQMAEDKDAEFKRLRVFGEDYCREGPPNYQMVQVGIGKTRAILGHCSVIMQKRKEKFILGIAPYPQSIRVEVVANESQKGLVEDLFSTVDKYIDKNNFYRGQKISPTGKFLNLSDISEADLILPADIKRELFRNVRQMVEKWGDYARFGIPGKRGIILAGPPGCGKSLCAKVLAKSLDCTFIWCAPQDISELGFTHIYDFARELAPAVVLLEDADVFGMDRRINGFNPRLGEFLNVLDGIVENKGVITLLTSNYVEVLDSALTHRPGRFDTKIIVGCPGPNEAFEILRRSLEKRKVVYVGDPGFLKSAANKLAESHASGAYIVEAVNYAMMLAVENGHGGDDLRMDVNDLKVAVERTLAVLAVTEEMTKRVAAEGIYKYCSWSEDK